MFTKSCKVVNRCVLVLDLQCVRFIIVVLVLGGVRSYVVVLCLGVRWSSGYQSPAHRSVQTLVKPVLEQGIFRLQLDLALNTPAPFSDTWLIEDARNKLFLLVLMIRSPTVMPVMNVKPCQSCFTKMIENIRRIVLLTEF